MKRILRLMTIAAIVVTVGLASETRGPIEQPPVWSSQPEHQEPPVWSSQPEHQEPPVWSSQPA